MPPALAVSYANFQQYLAAFQGTDTSQEVSINEDILAVSNYLNERLGRFFGREPVAVAHSYRAPASTRTLYVDDMSEEPDSVTVDGTTITDYEVGPLNAALGPRPEPFRYLYRPYGSFTSGSLVVVTARHGWPAIPAEIVRDTIEITGILRRQSPRATSRYDEGIGGFISESSASKQIIDRLIQALNIEPGFA